MANRKIAKVKGKLSHGSSGVLEGTALRALYRGEIVTTADVDTRPTVHVVGLHHTIPDERFSHCAFTGKVLRFPAVLSKAGYRTVEYSNGASMSDTRRAPGTRPDRHVSIFSEAQLHELFGEKLFTHTTSGNNEDQEVRAAFLKLVARALKKNVKPGDIVAHVYGPVAEIMQATPQAIHVETGIGYGFGPIGCYRAFESEAWRAWHFGRYSLANNGGGGTWPHYPEVSCTAVVPNYYDADQWALGDGDGLAQAAWPDQSGRPCVPGEPYLLFVGRMSSEKGIEIVNAIAHALPAITVAIITGEPFEEHRSKPTGENNDGPPRMNAPNLLWVGRVDSRAELAKWYGGALATLVPSRFHEPFGGVAVESLLCGTPVICSDFAAFTETVQSGPDHADGLRCMSQEDFCVAAELVVKQSAQHGNEWQAEAFRRARQASAQERFGLDAVAVRYKAALEHFRRLHTSGIRPAGHP